MADTGILIVSHSKNLAQGLFDLISQVAADVAISYVGGLDDGSIGTSFEGIQAALDDLMNNKYLNLEEKNFRGKKPKILTADWNRLEQDGLWEQNNK